MRKNKITRETNETKVSVSINLDGTGEYSNDTNVGFFDHMLDQLSRHSLIDLKVKTTGDTEIDDSSHRGRYRHSTRTGAKKCFG